MHSALCPASPQPPLPPPPRALVPRGAMGWTDHRHRRLSVEEVVAGSSSGAGEVFSGCLGLSWGSVDGTLETGLEALHVFHRHSVRPGSAGDLFRARALCQALEKVVGALGVDDLLQLLLGELLKLWGFFLHHAAYLLGLLAHLLVDFLVSDFLERILHLGLQSRQLCRSLLQAFGCVFHLRALEEVIKLSLIRPPSIHCVRPHDLNALGAPERHPALHRILHTGTPTLRLRDPHERTRGQELNLCRIERLTLPHHGPEVRAVPPTLVAVDLDLLRAGQADDIMDARLRGATATTKTESNHGEEADRDQGEDQG
mmetsp:Transcript_127727/g.331091  ORF Transcript_127727/g.331091 Transcript_127727/m.331091 type:complete len:314 (-) Transcript_127727:273-1214(-)